MNEDGGGRWTKDEEEGVMREGEEGLAIEDVDPAAEVGISPSRSKSPSALDEERRALPRGWDRDDEEGEVESWVGTPIATAFGLVAVV